jgi:hypothetical protein
MPRYVPPYDRREKHMPGYNFCGPGTNVWRRLRNGVRPMNRIDAACLQHDRITEPRGPYLGRNNPRRMRAADRRLIAACRRYYMDDPAAAGVIIAAMNAVLATGARGRS